jgi:predicted DNA-binding protein
MMYMGAARTQVYLTEEQRARLDDRARRDGLTMAHLVREAVDAYLSHEDDVEATYGAAPDLASGVPSRDEWDRRG